jgi:4a-hydroxytetrahydrobiopterin dehydratase
MTHDEIQEHLVSLNGWSTDASEKVISKEFVFSDFAKAMSFANKIATFAEEEGHHPDLLVSWGKVGVQLTTHDVGGLSEKDFILAAKIDTI